MKPIYLDFNATTPVDARVAMAMMPFLVTEFGNPSSGHAYAEGPRNAILEARRSVALLLGARPDEIIFTGGGTESNNMAIRGAALARRAKGNHIITTLTEHPAVTEVCRWLETRGFRVTWLPVDGTGLINPDELRRAIEPETILITVMHANNETGTIQPVEEIGRIAGDHGIVFHTDAAQSAGKIPVDADGIHADMISVAGHKLYAPKGVGALYVRRGTTIDRLMLGADHESHRRPGTENVMAIAGLGKAAEIAREWLGSDGPDRQRQLRDRLYDGLRARIPEIRLNGHLVRRLPNTLSVGFPGVEAAGLLQEMKTVAASAGAACHTDRKEISGVLAAMGVPDHFAAGTVRFSLGRTTTAAEIDEAVEKIAGAFGAVSGQSSIPVPGAVAARLTDLSGSLGCACKIRPHKLAGILRAIPAPVDPSVLVSHVTSDDAAVYQLNGQQAIVQTVDIIPPIADDPWQYGAIAAANALSDVYAMGAEPLFALSVVGFPAGKLDDGLLEEMLRGARDKAREAGIDIIGGHTTDDREPRFGLVVTGTVHPDRILRNSTALPGDALILTKPLGSGILTRALKSGLATAAEAEEAIQTMLTLNLQAARRMSAYSVHACTDVTGFGLLGHLWEMASGSGVTARIQPDSVPVMEGTWEFAAAGAIPAGTRSNLEDRSGDVRWTDGVPDLLRLILADAQTSGGLLIALPAGEANALLSELREAGLRKAAIIGILEAGPPCIIV